MGTIRIKGLNTVRSKGRVYIYLGRGVGATRIYSRPGTPEFFTEIAEAKSPFSRMDKSRLRTWVALYRASGEFKDLADSTKNAWLPWLDRIQAHFGDLRVRQFDKPRIRVDIKKWREKWRATPRTADYAKQVLSRVLAFAVSEGALQNNPCEGIPNLYSNDRSDIIWSNADFDAICGAASPVVALAARLAALTGLRRGDLLRLSWSHVRDTSIEIRTSKSGGKRLAIIPITPVLGELLSEIPKRATTVLTNTQGRPWSKSGFESAWRRAKERANLEEPQLHFHDLRGTAATNLYKAKLGYREIADILGWSEERVERLIDRYVKRDELMRERIRKMDEAERRTKSAKPTSKPQG